MNKLKNLKILFLVTLLINIDFKKIIAMQIPKKNCTLYSKDEQNIKKFEEIYKKFKDKYTSETENIKITTFKKIINKEELKTSLEKDILEIISVLRCIDEQEQNPLGISEDIKSSINAAFTYLVKDKLNNAKAEHNNLKEEISNIFKKIFENIKNETYNITTKYAQKMNLLNENEKYDSETNILSKSKAEQIESITEKLEKDIKCKKSYFKTEDSIQEFKNEKNTYKKQFEDFEDETNLIICIIKLIIDTINKQILIKIDLKKEIDSLSNELNLEYERVNNLMFEKYEICEKLCSDYTGKFDKYEEDKTRKLYKKFKNECNRYIYNNNHEILNQIINMQITQENIKNLKTEKENILSIFYSKYNIFINSLLLNHNVKSILLK